MEQQIKKLQNGLKNLKNKNSKIYFLTQDTEGCICFCKQLIISMLKYLRKQDIKQCILYEKTDIKV